ncbi:NCS1 family nucleobase:cation symporter-1 [Pectobacterium brasiliense]|uniref:NCS1 family nucleobase:cation symporter-1 n=1 Tax=Pectobacterium brasiliense TaxID=180957 RepID=UPI001CE1A319|nr:NCS1 family nucleobase:cation symporter-1 [Pectobacterium brasiliense]MCA5919918.1 NCS1 family nucleobase:cation symporter-1 [Pectobacterium brasiliense]MCA5926693.1 NCS1 family nucleobase:cation symporter-1 [Pectobacterium brasiliense]MCA5935079.1 NCS1 family nucleobase:cation symporter-1 [Pectobacterium brasiliense]MCA5938636.1 NCS1 family nucleobase:cation symporter-1 [Pectobacterium brasiliense]MCA5942928.1 NCS1 family nucleobase:cation symporter-1 [Pectobacterium brasiliense]
MPEKMITGNGSNAYSPKLCNEDLAPTRTQTWSWYNIFSFWMSDVHSMGGYVVAASFFALGLASWQVLLCLLVGICIVQVCANLVAKPSQMSGVPYAVICRQAFGVFGANIPAVIRGLIAFAWYGIQTYLAAHALMLVLLKFYPALSPLTQSHWLGLSTLGWICFGIMWFLQALVFWHGMNAIKRFIDFAGPAVYVVMTALAIWIVYQTGWENISFTLTSKTLTTSEQLWQMLTATALVVSYFSGPLLNFGDFSRYGKSMQEIRRGNRWGLPFNFLLFSIITVVIVSGTQSLFGRMITDPIETVSHIDSGFAVALGVLTMIIATIGINIVANFVSSAFDFSNCSPQRISFRTGGMIAAVGSVLLTPWNLFNSPELIHYTLDVLGAFIGPLFGILLMDFYVIKGGKVYVDDLFDATPKGKYWYRNGFNPNAIMALIPAVTIGLIITFTPQWRDAANFSWFIGAFLAAGCYRYLARRECVGEMKKSFAPRGLLLEKE